MKRIKEFFLKEQKPFTAKRDVDFFIVKLVSAGLVIVLILGIFLIPASDYEQTTFHEKTEKGTISKANTTENDPTQDTLNQLQETQVNARSVHNSLDHLYRKERPDGNGSNRRGNLQNQNASMILNRAGGDTKTQLSAGTRIAVKLNQKYRIAHQPMPIVGIVSKDVNSDGRMAIPSGSKMLGEVSLDESSDRASITWKSIIFSDGRERALSAIGFGIDGEMGVNGDVHSDAFKNVVGQTLTRFVGAYAAGSMNTGAFGANAGGHANGLRNAIAETATDRANATGENLQKERRWIELDHGMETIAVLNQAFAFREAGGVYDR